MGRRRTGSVYEKPAGSGQWWYAFLLRSGKRWAKPIPARPDGKAITETDARAYKDEVLRRYESGAWDPEAPAAEVPAPPPTVAVFARRWAAALTHSSADKERRAVEQHIAPSSLGDTPLPEVTPRQIAAWVMELRTRPSPRGGTFAPHTVRGIYGVLSKMFLSAVFEEIVAASPCQLPRGFLPPARDKVPGARNAWRYDRLEVVRLISSPDVPPDRRVLYATLFLAGLRRGEAIALRWSDVNRERAPLGCLTVSRSLGVTRAEKGTKTGAVREVPIHPTLAAVLAEWRLGGWERHYGRRPLPEDLLLPTRTFAHRDGKNVHSQLALDAKRLGFRGRRVHGSRHTFISMLIDDGARADLVAKITHTRPVRSAFDVYRNEAWSTLCAEVAKLKIERAPDELPLFKVAGAPAASPDSATPIATTQGAMLANTVKCSVETHDTLTLPVEGYEGPTLENGCVSSDPAKQGAPIPGSDAPSGSDSATGGSATSAASAPTRHPVGPHTGEAYAYAWVEALLARGEEL